MDILIGHDPFIYVKGQSYASRKIIPRAIYKFSTRSDEFSKENMICGRTTKTGFRPVSKTCLGWFLLTTAEISPKPGRFSLGNANLAEIDPNFILFVCTAFSNSSSLDGK